MPRNKTDEVSVLNGSLQNPRGDIIYVQRQKAISSYIRAPGKEHPGPAQRQDLWPVSKLGPLWCSKESSYQYRKLGFDPGLEDPGSRCWAAPSPAFCLRI